VTKRSMFIFICFAIAICMGYSSALYAQDLQSPAVIDSGDGVMRASVPRLIAFNGSLRDRNQRTLSGVVGIRFSVYREQRGGAPLWTEVQNLQMDDKGAFSVLLGATQGEGLPADLFTSGEPRWLAVHAQMPQEEEQPRILLVSVPYALKAGDADTLGGRPAGAYALSRPEVVSNSDVTFSTLTTSDAPASSAISGTGQTGLIAKWLDDAGTLGNSVIAEKDNKIGIFTANPVATLHIASAGDAFQYLEGFSMGIDVGWAARNHAAGKQWAMRLGANGNFMFRDDSLGLERLTLATTGNVGVGNSNPAFKLDVAGNANASGTVSGSQLVSSVATGTAPLVVSSTTQVANLNASLLGGLPASSFGDINGVVAGAGLVGGATSGSATLAQSPAALTRGITYLGGCDTCSALTDSDDQRTIYFNVVGPMTVNSVTCFSDAGAPVINIQRDTGGGSPANVLNLDLACSTTGVTSTDVAAAQATLGSNEKLDFVMVTAGGVAKRVTVSIKTTVN
jgi:hypothetical protein